jgi:cytochrome b subunit of formate dehydrogenase
MRNTRWLYFITVLVIGFCALGLGLNTVPLSAEGDADIIAPSDTATCLGCHGDAMDAKKLAASAHGALTCQDCHKGIDRFPHPEKAVAKKPACATCHTGEAATVRGSIHTGAKAPTCATCHPGKGHEIPVITKKSAAQKEASCRACHADAVKALAGGVHANVGHAGGTCIACHADAPHGVRAAGNARDACKSCHAKEADALTQGAHANAGNGQGCVACHGASTHAVARPAADAASCRRCHADAAAALAGTAHGAAGCRACHAGDIHGLTRPTMTLAEKNDACRRCHADEAKRMATSAHAQVTDGPTCTSCHGASLHAMAPASKKAQQPRSAVCATCHTNIAKSLAGSVHGNMLAKNGSMMDCLACHGGSPHGVLVPDKRVRADIEASCQRCHAKQATALQQSVHHGAEVQPGDRPTCFSCHGKVVHGIQRATTMTKAEEVAICSRCHSDPKLMARYGMTTDAVSSYKQSFHGRGLMIFGMTKAASCIDCHGLHGVRAPADPASPVHASNTPKTCGQCHPGATMNFGMSGANHLRMKIQDSKILTIEELAFKWLIYVAMGMLFIMVLLDLRRKLFCPDTRPECGRNVTVLIALGLFSLVAGILLAFLHVPNAGWAWIASLVFVAAAYIVDRIRRRSLPAPKHGKMYPRFTLAQRIQHILLASSFTLLVLTGFPLHFAHVTWTHYILMLFGGLSGARIVHRCAGLLMLANWGWHICYLFYRWHKARYSLKSWTMFPAWKDVVDCVHFFAWGLGIRKSPPEWERFQFREKFDYFADIWGTIVMSTTGIVLWFPVLMEKYLPDWAFGFSFIAHSYEGTLALMAILVWHFYNTHFNPDMFPMNPAWLTGTLSEEEMAREHPLEKARMDAAMSAGAEVHE